MLVVSYLAGIPPGNKNPEKPAVLKNFALGVQSLSYGDRGSITNSNKPIECDVAVLQGFVHENSKNKPHLNLRKNVIQFQKNRGKRTVIIDSNLFLYRDPGNTKKYLRYSYDGVFPTTGEYCNKIVDETRWEQIKQDLKIDLQPWKDTGKYILVCAQRDGGWSMGGKSTVNWIKETISELRRYTNKPIKIRMHPGDGNNRFHIRKLKVKQYTNVELIDYERTTLLENLKNAAAVVVYNSSPAVAAAIEGVPVFVTDPEPQRCQAFTVSHNNLAKIKSPVEFDRELWIRQIAQMHWNQRDLAMGKTWEWMRKFV